MRLWGWGEEESTSQQSPEPKTRGTSAPLPPGASPAQTRRIRELRETFPIPTADTEEGREAIAKGREACEAKTPTKVKAELYAQVRSELSPEQREMVERLDAYEAKAKREYSFVAGQLAALLYEKSLPQAQASYGFQGCVYELARGLEGEIVGGGG